MAQVDTFGVYVRDRLEEWGREFALHRDCEYLGYRSKDMLQVLIDHRGEIPAKAVGSKPLETPPLQQQIEDIVCNIARYNLPRAVVLRAYYCGRGRRGVERFDTANELLFDLRLPNMSRAKYFSEHEIAFAEVRGVLLGISRAA